MVGLDTAVPKRAWGPGRKRITPAQQRKARRMRAKGDHYKTIAIELGMSLTQAWRLCQWPR